MEDSKSKRAENTRREGSDTESKTDWQRMREKDGLKCTYFKRASETQMYTEKARKRQRQEVQRHNKAHEDEPYKINHEITYWNPKPWHDCVSVLHGRRHISEGTPWPHVCKSFDSLNAWAYLYSQQYALDMTWLLIMERIVSRLHVISELLVVSVCMFA